MKQIIGAHLILCARMIPFCIGTIEIIARLQVKFVFHHRCNHQTIKSIGFIPQCTDVTVLKVGILRVSVRNRGRKGLSRGVNILGTHRPVVYLVFTAQRIAMFGQ